MNNTTFTENNNVFSTLLFIFVAFVITMIVTFTVPSKAQEWQTDIQKTHTQLSEAYEENARMCKISMKKVSDYQKNMRDDEYAQATLRNYKRVLKKYCDPITKSQEGTK